MEPQNAKIRFLQRLNLTESNLSQLAVETGIEAMLQFYAEERMDGCDLDADGDMLLYQWGTHKWGKIRQFEVNITRQLIVTDDDDDEPQQLSLTFCFEESVGIDADDGDEWCDSPDDLENLREVITDSDVLSIVGEIRPVDVTLTFDRC